MTPNNRRAVSCFSVQNDLLVHWPAHNDFHGASLYGLKYNIRLSITCKFMHLGSTKARSVPQIHLGLHSGDVSKHARVASTMQKLRKHFPPSRFFFFFFFFGFLHCPPLPPPALSFVRLSRMSILVSCMSFASPILEPETTVELQWLEHLWNHKNMFETGVVRANECYSKRQARRDIFSFFLYEGILFVLIKIASSRRV